MLTNPNITDIVIVQDRSGSMNSIKEDAQGGINSFIKEQASGPGQTFVSFVEFDNQIDTLYLRRRSSSVGPYTLVPRGFTALTDAIGYTINKLGDLYAELSENDRPGRVYFVINTDGQENASRNFSNAQLNELITRQRSKYNWQFVFLAANQDAIATATNYGMAAGSAATYDSFSGASTRTAYASASASVMSSRVHGGEAVITDEQRQTILPNS